MMAVLRALACIAVLAVSAHPGDVRAEAYPTRSIRLIVPFAAGGPTDVIGRIVAQKLSDAWGQQVVTENVAGRQAARSRRACGQARHRVA
jgi:tripartite-type tricarboxylate transporter receptor subunit TctC